MSVRPGTAGLLIDIECSRVRDSSWMYLTSFVTIRIGIEGYRIRDSAWMYLASIVTPRIGVELIVVQGNYPTLLR